MIRFGGRYLRLHQWLVMGGLSEEIAEEKGLYLRLHQRLSTGGQSEVIAEDCRKDFRSFHRWLVGAVLEREGRL